MPSYVQASMDSIGELFLYCGSKKTAGSNSYLETGGGENFSIVAEYGWEMSPNSAASLENVSFSLSLTIPAYDSAVSMVFNAVNQRDKVTKLVLNDVTKRYGKCAIQATYTAENGQITHVSFHKHSAVYNSENKMNCAIGSMTILFKFEKMSFDDNQNQTSGNIKTTDGG
ncbi:hypothetical protein [Francisella marina]|uniref:Type VI secretion system tube protein Hcp n=1 Tax=Francisella marina TaxID=2249302 RepID=A0ABX5ZJ30_9GAMM|nr:hypothetical protein [Francisella marina]QEO58225.1 hypothetical protein F0R74_10020 [Francisella marina]QEO60171.1 hypothetical protein F0R75_10095 [Francisella marina]